MSKRFSLYSKSRKRMLRGAWIASLLPFFCLPLTSFAQQNKVIINAPEEIVAKRGAVVRQTLNVTVLPGLHVNSDKPKDEFLIPLKLTWFSGPLVTQSVTYPKPEQIKVGGQDLVVFTGKFDIQTEFKTPDHAPPGPGSMTGKLRYQACNSQMCFRPASADVILPVIIQ